MREQKEIREALKRLKDEHLRRMRQPGRYRQAKGGKVMPTQREVLQVISSYPEGVRLNQLAGDFDTRPFALTKMLSDLKKKNYISHDGEIYRVTDAGNAFLAAWYQGSA